jgi:hypothetical protein
MSDRFTFAAPLSVLGTIAEHLFLKRYMDRFLGQRNEIVKQVIELVGVIAAMANRQRFERSDFIPCCRKRIRVPLGQLGNMKQDGSSSVLRVVLLPLQLVNDDCFQLSQLKINP